jgi:hypothetical protein
MSKERAAVSRAFPAVAREDVSRARRESKERGTCLEHLMDEDTRLVYHGDVEGTPVLEEGKV